MTGRDCGPLLTLREHERLLAGRERGSAAVECSLDLGRSTDLVSAGPDAWTWRGVQYPYPPACRERTVYYWEGGQFRPAARFGSSLVKLVPTEWGAPTFEIDGIKMLPTDASSPYEDARRKIELVRVRGRAVLDTCGGLGYYAAWCLAGGASSVLSFERNPDVLWLRGLNPWSPEADPRLTLHAGDVTHEVTRIADAAVDVVLHDPPRFAIAGDLYSGDFYAQLARVVRPGGRLFHYTGAPNSRSRGRNLAGEVVERLRVAGFESRPVLDGVLATRR